MKALKFITTAIVAFLIFAETTIAIKLIVPGDHLTLTENYELKTINLKEAYVGYRKPFLLSGTTILLCNNKLETFRSAGTVITHNVDPNHLDANVIHCQ